MRNKKTKTVKPKTKEEAITEAYRYLENAKETLAKSSIKYGIRYADSKYVREAAGIAYLAPLKAIDGYLIGKGIHPDKLPTSIEEYFEATKKIPQNGKLKARLHTVYENLHILAYYRGGVSVEMVKDGMTRAKEIVEMMKS